MAILTPTEHTTVGRLPERARYDEETIHAILDDGLVCHLGVVAGDRPVVLPTTYGRVGSTVYVHGSPAAGFLRLMKKGAVACLTVTHLDGLVLARSAFHHSMNYRSAVVMGQLRPVTDADERRRALDAIVDHAGGPGRSQEARPGDDKEIAGTLILALEIVEASAKVRTGGPVDEERDMDLPVWAGVVPLRLTAGEPLPDTGIDESVTPRPASVIGVLEQRRP